MISKKWVLTAAHCTYDLSPGGNFRPFRPNEYVCIKLILREYSTSNQANYTFNFRLRATLGCKYIKSVHCTLYNIDSFQRHHRYEVPKMEFDLALLKLEDKALSGPSIPLFKPIHLAARKKDAAKPKQKVTVYKDID